MTDEVVTEAEHGELPLIVNPPPAGDSICGCAHGLSEHDEIGACLHRLCGCGEFHEPRAA